MSAVCEACGGQWPRHPALEVVCPKCNAGVGVGCSRPSGHAGPIVEPHIEREQRAVDVGVLEPCPEGPTRKPDGERPERLPHNEQQPALL